MSSYIVREDHWVGGHLAVCRGDLVNIYLGQDFGLANSDTRQSGIRHVAVRRPSDEEGTFFTIPFSKLKRMRVG